MYAALCVVLSEKVYTFAGADETTFKKVCRL